MPSCIKTHQIKSVYLTSSWFLRLLFHYLSLKGFRDFSCWMAGIIRNCASTQTRHRNCLRVDLLVHKGYYHICDLWMISRGLLKTPGVLMKKPAKRACLYKYIRKCEGWFLSKGFPLK